MTITRIAGTWRNGSLWLPPALVLLLSAPGLAQEPAQGTGKSGGAFG
jgi:hypothetical protein